ncbi:phosphopantetheine-binding protein [Nocardia sp. NPDC051570]|uniref:phosphopantetheine-binding protein n=1 Tax=Nocardia sp. NPDC051570 TaxID=3364324 RepID=UPI00379DA5E8
MADTLDLDVAIARHATAEFDDSTLLTDAGLESLSLIRLAVEAATDEDAEIDATRLVDIHTIGDLKVWLLELVDAAAGAEES